MRAVPGTRYGLHGYDSVLQRQLQRQPVLRFGRHGLQRDDAMLQRSHLRASGALLQYGQPHLHDAGGLLHGSFLRRHTLLHACRQRLHEHHSMLQRHELRDERYVLPAAEWSMHDPGRMLHRRMQRRHLRLRAARRRVSDGR